ncbi:lysozyme inhibitor LprI family protein [Xanthomonas sp. 60]
MHRTHSALSALLLAAALTATSTASATPAAGLSATFDTCTDRARGMKDQQACIAQEKARQDKRLNDVYAQLGRRLTPASRAKLQVAERAWLQSHARDGEFVTALLGAPATVNPEGGVMEAQRLAARATVLEQYLEQVR